MIVAVVGPDGEANLARRQREQTPLHRDFSHTLGQFVGVRGPTRHIVGALGRRHVIAEGVQTARAELRAAGRAVKQARDGGAAYPARLIVLKLSLGNTDIGFPGPVLVTHIARQSADELIDVIGV
ncbi:hypothetical protein D3C71_1553640 [compost metagenome]